MKLWLLQAIEGHPHWVPWYDKTFGMVIRAETEIDARTIAAQNADDETTAAWIHASSSTCVELTAHGAAGLILRDHANA